MNEAEQNFADWLAAAIDLAATKDEQDVTVRTFAEDGLMTNNAGLVVRMEDGSEYQCTIVQSERAR